MEESKRYKGTITKEAMNKIASNLVSKWQRILALVAVGLSIMFGVAAFIKDYYTYAMILAISALVLALEFLWIGRSAAKKMVRRMQARLGTGEYSVIFEKNGLRVRGQRSKDYIRIRYSEVLNLWEKPEALYIYTSELMTIIIDKTVLSNEEAARLRMYLEGHCIRLAQQKNSLR